MTTTIAKEGCTAPAPCAAHGPDPVAAAAAANEEAGAAAGGCAAATSGGPF